MQQNWRSHGTGASLTAHIALAHTRVQIRTHLQTILGLLLISSLSYVRGFPRHPAHAHTHASSDKRGWGEEDKQAKEDGGQGTHADKPDNRQETLESSRCYFLSSSQFPFWTKQVDEKQHSHEKKRQTPVLWKRQINLKESIKKETEHQNRNVSHFTY